MGFVLIHVNVDTLITYFKTQMEVLCMHTSVHAYMCVCGWVGVCGWVHVIDINVVGKD